MTFWLILFILGTLVLLLLMARDSLGDQLPSRCPRCGAPDEDVSVRKSGIAVYSRWYRERGDKGLQCRHCGTRFKDHPNGTLVEDRDP